MTRAGWIKVSFLTLAGVVVGTAAVLHARAGVNNEEAVRAVVQLYFDGITKPDSVALRRAFAPESRLMFVRRDGSLYMTPFEDWVAFTRRPGMAAGKENRLLSIDIAGSAAVAKVDLEWPGVHYVDYLSLLKTRGEWRIVTKIWWQEPR